MRRKHIKIFTATDREEFITLLNDVIGNYGLTHYDIETHCTETLGCEMYYIDVYKR